ncbi:hypothetical protein MHUMG1_05479 [Metarhizium humberi]|uniref:Ankyrin repeat protein n=1 Tax=Metarhizium humberi TaxID=2596975 RepID=A0A9P8M9Q3_9HYPO|nr:hypothetical protein MHUMG1_05479 [Metarhizium humberi]
MPAAWKLALAVVITLAATSAADSGDDFSNNLFSDLAPLLALFGERVTMQFMSQSTGWADSIILAMAPLGIITIIASAIRVGGPSWLKAIIGRARENLAVAEAELMSSTSHEVCELWNGREVVRCMGSPLTAEFICLRPAKMKRTENGANQVPDILELKEALDKQYLKELPSNDGASFWDTMLDSIGRNRESASSKVERGANSQTSVTIPVPKLTIVRNQAIDAPNISLNSHGYFGRGELRAVAVFGTILQLGVLTYFGFATYHPALKFTKGDDAVANYAFPCTATGTITLVAGLLLCAHVVESSTEEKRYQPSKETKARLVWLQQAQTVGDQSFQSFALSAGDNQTLITTSCRVNKKSQGVHLELKTIVGTAVSLCGFVVQFIGLRGMHWSASVAQLGAVIAMAALRAWVRRGLAQPLQRVRLTPEHELEWFAMALGDFDGIPWQPDRSPKEYGEQGQTTRAGVNSMKNSGGNPTTHSVMVTRRTLCELAGWQGPASAEALTLARAIKITMDALSSYLPPQGDFTWSLGALAAGQEERRPEFCWARDITIETLWKDIEAVLSLRLYSVHSQKRQSQDQPKSAQTQPRKSNAQLRARELPAERGLRLLGPGTRALRRDLAWWMPPDAARIFDIKEDENGTMVVENHRIVGYGGQQGIRVARYNGTEASFSPDNAYDCEIEERTLLASESYDSLELLYAQDMFTKFMQSVAEKMTRAIEGGSNLRPKDSSNMGAWKCFTLHNDRLSKIAQDIHNCGLGNIHQIYLSIIQPLSTEHKLPSPDSVITLARKHAKPHERLQHFKEPSEIYLWLFRTANTFPRKSSIFVKATAILLEILRRATLTKKLWEAQCYPEAKIHPMRTVKLHMEEELKRVDRTLLTCLMSLYEKRGRQWECDIIQGAGLTIEGHTTYTATFDSTPFHRMCQGYEDHSLNRELAVRYLDWKDIHDCTPLHYAAANDHLAPVLLLLLLQSDVNARDILDWTPLHYACNARQFLVVQKLLEEGRSQVNAQGIDGVAPLHLAAMNGNIETVQLLIRAGAALDIQDASGTTALHWAAFKGHEAIVEYLYEDLNKKLPDKNGRTALHLAAIAGKENVVRLLVPCPDKQTNANMDTFDSDGCKPIHYAAKRGHEAVVRYLVGETGANKEAKNKQGSTLLHTAAAYGKEAVVRYLVGETGANKEAKDKEGYTPLHIAAAHGYEAVVRYLVGETGANKEAKDKKGCTPLHIAAAYGYKAVVRYLVSETGANKEAKNGEGCTPLHEAVTNSDEAIVRYLISETGANKEAKNREGCTPLHEAVKHGNKAIIRYLINEAGANKEAKNQFQETPLHLAVTEENEAIVRYLIGEARADLEAKDDIEQTPLYRAAEEENEAIVRYLISEAGANIKVRDIYQRTPLHYAAMGESEAIARYFISETGADPEAKDGAQRTPLHMAAGFGHEATVRYLISEAGADLEAQDDEQKTPLHQAAFGGQDTIVRYLVTEAGANKEARDYLNKTPAQLAAERGEKAVVRILEQDEKEMKGEN